jgi:hypothetical protein
METFSNFSLGHYVCQRWRLLLADFEALSCQATPSFNKNYNLETVTEKAIIYSAYVRPA